MVYRAIVFLLMWVTSEALAHGYQARVDEAQWHLEPSPLKCRLWQSVPNYGDAVFEVEAGESLTFYVDAYRPVRKSGKVDLAIIAPEWRPDIARKPIGNAKVKAGRRPIELAEEVASELLAELQVGMFPSFTHHGWYNQHSVSFDVSAVNFQSAYLDYVTCLSSLYPAGYDELRQSLLHFETNKYGIKGKLKDRLDLIAGYIAVDPSVKTIYVGGHTDSVGRRGHNWELSRLRAKAVKDYLESQGVFTDIITMKYFGEGRPARKNNTKANKAVNRRVLVRLSR